MKHFKFKHYLLVNKTINILAKNKKQSYKILYKYYLNASEYYLN